MRRDLPPARGSLRLACRSGTAGQEARALRSRKPSRSALIYASASAQPGAPRRPRRSRILWRTFVLADRDVRHDVPRVANPDRQQERDASCDGKECVGRDRRARSLPRPMRRTRRTEDEYQTVVEAEIRGQVLDRSTTRSTYAMPPTPARPTSADGAGPWIATEQSKIAERISTVP